MNNSKKIATIIFLFIAIYAVWNGRNWVLGPQIKVTSPTQGENVKQNPLWVEGVAKNVSFISLNGRQIFVDKDGKFKEKVLLSPGENSLEIFAKDRFNKEKIDRIYLYNSIQD